MKVKLKCNINDLIIIFFFWGGGDHKGLKSVTPKSKHSSFSDTISPTPISTSSGGLEKSDKN